MEYLQESLATVWPDLLQQEEINVFFLTEKEMLEHFLCCSRKNLLMLFSVLASILLVVIKNK